MINQPSINTSPFEAQSQLLKVLSHPARLAILNILRDGEHCVCHIEAHLGFRQAYISQQLAVLREAGIIQDRRDGWNVFYRVAEPRIYDVLAAVEQIHPAEGSLTLNRSTGTHANQVNCPCPKCSASGVE